jgi:two-component system chemotaxis response regulator CheY
VAKILIVDSDERIRQVIKVYIERLGHTVVAEAETGNIAFQQYKLFKPDIVTMNITMSKENRINNGIEALKSIKEFDKEANVIMITSHGEEKLIIEALMSGAKGYIVKPINEEKIKIALVKIIVKPSGKM